MFIAFVLAYSLSQLHKTGDKIYTVSNNFDLAVSVDVKSMSLKHSTGTKPFMGIDLIYPGPDLPFLHNKSGGSKWGS